MSLQGAMLRNTAYAFGVAVYTGNDTKVMVNMEGPPTKRSNVEKTANYMTLGMFILLLTMSACSAIGFSIFRRVITQLTSLILSLYHTIRALLSAYQ